MLDEMRVALKQKLLIHEGYRERPYTDSTGHLTIGIGRNLSDRGISISEAYYLLDNDINYFYECLIRSLDFFNDLSHARQAILLDMCFNMGIKSLMEFSCMIDCLKKGDYENASKEMLDSKWATQVGKRATDLAEGMKRDVFIVNG